MTRGRIRHLTLLVLLAAACRQPAPATTGEPTPEPLAEQTNQVPEIEVQAGFIGVLTPKSQAEVVAPFTTTVKKYLVNVGDRVTVGTKLALLDEAPLKEALSKAEADLQGARAGYASAAQAAATQLRAFQAGVAARTTYETALGAASEARARLDGAQAGFAASKTKLGKTVVISEISGKVALQFVKAGGNVTEGSPILRVISSDELFVRFAIPTDQSDSLKEGMSIDIAVAGHDTVKVKGKVISIQPELDPIARMIVAEAELVGEVPVGLQAGLVCRIKPPKPGSRSASSPKNESLKPPGERPKTEPPKTANPGPKRK